MESVNRTVLSDEALQKASECLKVIAHPARLRMIELLMEQRLCVGELADACGLPQNQASEHLRLMQRCGFLTVEKEGRSSFYRVSEDSIGEIMRLISRRFAAD